MTKSKDYIETLNPKKSHLSDAAEDLIKEGKKFANEVYQQGVDQVTNTEELVKDYSEKLVQKIQEKPITSVLLAAGVGILLASFLRK